jgi:hypothetical protein
MLNVINRTARGVMKCTAPCQKLLEDTCQEGLDNEDPVPVDAVGGQRNLSFEGSGEPGDAGLSLGTPGRQGTDPHGHQRFAAVTRVVRDTDASAIASTGGEHA